MVYFIFTVATKNLQTFSCLLKKVKKAQPSHTENGCFNFTWGCKSIPIYYSVTACISLGNSITHVMSMEFGICPH